MDNSSAVILASFLFSFVALAVVYVATALGLSRIFAKVGEQAWQGWVPVVNVITVLRLGGYSPLWVIAFFIPVVNIVGAVYFYLAVHALNRRFGKDVVFTIIAIVVLPVWACLLGFGSAVASGARPQKAAERGASPSGVTTPTQKTTAQDATPATPATPFVAIVPPPPAAFVTSPEGVTPAAPTRSTPPPAGMIIPPTFIAPPPGLTPPAAPRPAPSVQVPDPVAAEPETSPVATPFAAAETSPPAELATPVDPADPADSGSPAAAVWVLETGEGQRVSIAGVVALLGRNPASDSAYPDAQLVSVDDPAKTVSKTHARIELVDGAWSLTDLGSTNGVLLVAEDGQRLDLPARSTVTLTEHFQLGDLPIRLFAEQR